VLLVLDNFEHVLDAAPGLTALVAASTRIRLVVTSRERLHLSAELEVPVQPLSLPCDDSQELERFVGTPSVAMLVDQVRRFQPDFEVTPANRAAVAEICVRLDGLPLALELAAARLKLFSPTELTFRLRHRMGLLTSDTRDRPDRHRTMRAALTWSHNLMTPDERALFRRLSVFVGGATLDAVQDVCAVDDPLGTAMSLVEKSLVRRRLGHDEAAELVMLESLREYAAEQLAEHGEVDGTRTRHARYFAEFGTRTEELIGTDEESWWVDAVGAHQANVRAALAHATGSGDVCLVLPLASALGWYAYTRGRLGDVRVTVDRALAVVDASGARAPDEALSGTLLIGAVIATGRGDLDRAESLLARAMAINDRVGAPRRAAIGSAFRGHLARARGRFDEAVAHHERAGRLHEDIGATPGVAWSRYDLGLLARGRGRLDEAAEHLRTSLARFREMDHGWAIGCCAGVLAAVELRRRRPDVAATLLAEALERCARVDDDRGIAQCLEGAAAVAAARADPRTAARLLGAGAALRERVAAPIADEDRDDRDDVLARVRRELGPDTADLARCAGRDMPTASALAIARETVRRTPPPPAAPSPVLGVLTRREREVALLVARGRTNRQIGRELGITEKTAEVHVHHIIRKLDASSRAEVAAVVAGGRERPLSGTR
jgi:non-specific serine/threonine protein kinase